MRDLVTRKTPLICTALTALLCTAVAAAPAQSIAQNANGVATLETETAPRGEQSAFLLIEHRSARMLVPSAQPTPLSPGVVQARAAHRGLVANRSSAARSRVIAHIHAAELRHGLPLGLLDALVAAESAYHPFAVSKAGAAGLAQLMPATARSLGVIDRFDVRSNLDGGARYLRAMIDKFGSIAMALAAYNAGPGAVLRWGGIPRNGETPTYVARVLDQWHAVWR